MAFALDATRKLWAEDRVEIPGRQTNAKHGRCAASGLAPRRVPPHEKTRKPGYDPFRIESTNGFV
jgi:hypothetical protein